MMQSLALLPWKLYLLVRYDVKQQLGSVWFYLILLGNTLLPPAWFVCYPENSAFKVLMVDDLGTANFENARRAIQAEDFPVHVRRRLEDALDELLRFEATAVIHVRADGRVSWYAATPRIKKLLTRAVQASMLGELNDQLDRTARRAGQAILEIPLEARPYFEGLNKRHVSTSTFMVRVTWYFTSLVTLTMFVLAKPSLSKFLRMYSMPMLLLGKLLAGFTLGFFQVGSFLAMAWCLGFHLPGPGSYLLAYALSVFSGVAFGCLMGGLPLALSRDLLGLVFAALMGLSLTFMGFAQLSAFLTPISNMDPFVHQINMANPLYNLNQVIHNCTYLGDAPWEEPNRTHILRVLVQALLLLFITLVVLHRL